MERLRRSRAPARGPWTTVLWQATREIQKPLTVAGKRLLVLWPGEIGDVRSISPRRESERGDALARDGRGRVLGRHLPLVWARAGARTSSANSATNIWIGMVSGSLRPSPVCPPKPDPR